MKKDKIRKVLAVVSVASVAGGLILAAGCKGSCGNGSCSKGSCNKGAGSAPASTTSCSSAK